MLPTNGNKASNHGSPSDQWRFHRDIVLWLYWPKPFVAVGWFKVKS